MKRAAVLVLFLSLLAVASAQNPHFVGPVTSVLNDDGSLTVSWKEAGLGNNQNVTYSLTGNAVATYACRNNGGNFPKDPKKIDQQGTLNVVGTFNSGQNGQISESLTGGPPAPPAPSYCKGNQELVLLAVSYTNIVLTDTTNNVSASAPDRSRTYIVIP